MLNEIGARERLVMNLRADFNRLGHGYRPDPRLALFGGKCAAGGPGRAFFSGFSGFAEGACFAFGTTFAFGTSGSLCPGRARGTLPARPRRRARCCRARPLAT